MRYYPPNFGGWPASTFKDPHELLQTIWHIARFEYTGLKGWLTENETVLEFSGIRIRIVDDPFQFRDERDLRLEITDGKIQSEFFDLWRYLRTNDKVRGGPDEEDKKFFSSERSGYQKRLDEWVDKWRAYVSSHPKKWGFTMKKFLSWEYEDAPREITADAIKRRNRERKKNAD